MFGGQAKRHPACPTYGVNERTRKRARKCYTSVARRRFISACRLCKTPICEALGLCILVTRLCNSCASLRQFSRVQLKNGVGISVVVQNETITLHKHGSRLLLGGSARARCAVPPCLGVLRTSGVHTSWHAASSEAQHIWRALDSRHSQFGTWCALHTARLVYHMMFLYQSASVGVMAHCSCALCLRPGEAVEVRLGPKPRVDEKTFIDWLNKETSAAMTPTDDEIVAKCQELQQQIGDGIKVTSWKKWGRPSKGRHPDISAREPQTQEYRKRNGKPSSGILCMVLCRR